MAKIINSSESPSKKLKSAEEILLQYLKYERIEEEGNFNLLEFIDNFEKLENLYLELKAFPVEEILKNRSTSHREENIIFQLKSFKKQFLEMKEFIKKNSEFFSEKEARKVYHYALQDEIRETVHILDSTGMTLVDRKSEEKKEMIRQEDFGKNKKIFRKIYEEAKDYITTVENNFKRDCEEYENESIDFEILSKKVDQKLIKLSKSIDIQQICEMYQTRRFGMKKSNKCFSYHLKFIEE